VIRLDEVSNIGRKSAIPDRPSVTARQRKPKSSSSTVTTNDSGPPRTKAARDDGFGTIDEAELEVVGLDEVSNHDSGSH